MTTTTTERRVTYWFWHGDQIVASVRVPEGTSEGTARWQALAWHDRLPLCDRPNETPLERRIKIGYARIKVYPEGN